MTGRHSRLPINLPDPETSYTLDLRPKTQRYRAGVSTAEGMKKKKNKGTRREGHSPGRVYPDTPDIYRYTLYLYMQRR